MLVPIFFIFIMGTVIAVAIFNANSNRVSGISRPQHLRHRIDRDISSRPRIESQSNPVKPAPEPEKNKDEYDDFFKEYDDFFEKDDDPFDLKK